MSAGDLRVETVLLRHACDRGQLLRRDLATRDTRDDRIRPAPLDIREKPIVGVLDRRLARRQLREDARHERRDGGLANLAAIPRTVSLEKLVERFHVPVTSLATLATLRFKANSTASSTDVAFATVAPRQTKAVSGFNDVTGILNKVTLAIVSGNDVTFDFSIQGYDTSGPSWVEIIL